MNEADRAAKRQRPNTLPVIKRVHLPQRLRDDAWWLCPAPERPPARVLRFPQRSVRSRPESKHHD